MPKNRRPPAHYQRSRLSISQETVGTGCSRLEPVAMFAASHSEALHVVYVNIYLQAIIKPDISY